MFSYVDTKGGEGVKTVTVSGYSHRTRVYVDCWHTGYRDGAADTSHASLILYRDDTNAWSQSDGPFDTYNLGAVNPNYVPYVADLDFNSSVTFSIAISNTGASVKTYGVRAVIYRY